MRLQWKCHVTMRNMQTVGTFKIPPERNEDLLKMSALHFQSPFVGAGGFVRGLKQCNVIYTYKCE